MGWGEKGRWVIHLLPSLSAVDRKRVWVKGVAFELWGWLACFFGFFATLMAVAAAPPSQGVHFAALAAAGVNTNDWLQLFAEANPRLCLLYAVRGPTCWMC